jgi:hypothetical protein
MPTDDEGLLRDFLNWAVVDAWQAEPRPNLMPSAYVPELAKLSRRELLDVCWHLARTIHDMADDPEGDYGELRVAVDYVEWLRRPKAVKLRKRD